MSPTPTFNCFAMSSGSATSLESFGWSPSVIFTGEHVLLCRGGNDLAADGAVSLGNADAGFHRGADTVNPFDAGDLVEMEVADSAGVRFVEFLIAQVGAVDGHRIVGVSEHGGQLPCQGVVHGIAEQEGAGDERRADHDGDACGYEHALGFFA